MSIAKVHRISAAAPDDVCGVERAIADGRIRPDGIRAIFGKTEGNGCVNDFSRGFAAHSLRQMLERHIGMRARDACLVMSGGTEGGMAPHWLVLERGEGEGRETEGSSLAIGSARTADMPSEGIGRLSQVDMVADGVREAMRDAQIKDPAEVHYVQIKCPLLTLARIQDAQARSAEVVTRDTLKSMSLSRAASALGVAVALGEVERGAIGENAICYDASLWSARASASAGIELMRHEIVVLGMSGAWSGPLAIGHAVMRDSIDVEPVRAVLARLGLAGEGQLNAAQRNRVVAVLAKAEPSHDGLLRGYRHTMLDDSDISATRHARAFVCGVLGGLIGHAELFVSGGAEHQGPDGGGPVAIIARRTHNDKFAV
jgi:cyanuric acid amidohydrolase